MAAFASSYIKTVASQVTRSADSASITGSNFDGFYNQAEGSFYTEAATFSTNDAKAVSITDGTASGQNNSFILGYSSATNKIQFIVTANGSGQASFTSLASYVKNSFVKIAGGYKFNDFGGTTNAESITTDTSGIVPVVTSFEIGLHRIGNPTQRWNGTIKKISYYPARLTNEQLQSLTS
jgi:hypothetical protein